MHRLMFVALTGGMLLGSFSAWAEEQGPGSITWPVSNAGHDTVSPVSNRENSLFKNESATYPAYRPMRPANSQPDNEAMRPIPMEKGHEVEVVPPPAIPIEANDAELSKQPKQNWRPIERGPRQLREPPPDSTGKPARLNGALPPPPPLAPLNLKGAKPPVPPPGLVSGMPVSVPMDRKAAESQSSSAKQ